MSLLHPLVSVALITTNLILLLLFLQIKEHVYVFFVVAVFIIEIPGVIFTGIVSDVIHMVVVVEAQH